MDEWRQMLGRARQMSRGNYTWHCFHLMFTRSINRTHVKFPLVCKRIEKRKIDKVVSLITCVTLMAHWNLIIMH
jgi:hypothetical protein